MKAYPKGDLDGVQGAQGSSRDVPDIGKHPATRGDGQSGTRGPGSLGTLAVVARMTMMMKVTAWQEVQTSELQFCHRVHVLRSQYSSHRRAVSW